MRRRSTCWSRVKDRVFVGPAIGLLHAAVHEAPEGALHAGVRHGIELGLAAASRAYPEMKKRGIRVVIGGDYGFARTPQGENARDIEHFVRYLGYSPSEALVCATRYGAELMGLGDRGGTGARGLSGRSAAGRWRSGRRCKPAAAQGPAGGDPQGWRRLQARSIGSGAATGASRGIGNASLLAAEAGAKRPTRSHAGANTSSCAAVTSAAGGVANSASRCSTGTTRSANRRMFSSPSSCGMPPYEKSAII